MPKAGEQGLLDALMDSWQRNNTILINLLRAIAEGELDARAAIDSPTIAEMFAHVHYVRLVFISENAPEVAGPISYQEWSKERDPVRLQAMLLESSNAVRNAVYGRLESTGKMDQHYDHPILLLQHMIWHEGYHHGQIKLALKVLGQPLADKEIGPVTWSIWTRKTAGDSGKDRPSR